MEKKNRTFFNGDQMKQDTFDWILILFLSVLLFLLWFIVDAVICFILYIVPFVMSKNWSYFLCTFCKWRCKCAFSRNSLEQQSHWKLLSFEWVLIWFSKFCLWMKSFWQISQWNSRTFVWTFICVLNRLLTVVA